MNSLSGAMMSTDSKADDSLQLTLVPGEPETSLMVSLPLDEISERELYALVPHSLDSLKNAVLMNRVDSKFLLPSALAA